MSEPVSSSFAPEAVVFDCDGLLLDTEGLWGRAERDLLESLGGEWSEDVRQSTCGRSVTESASLLVSLAGKQLAPQEATDLLMERFREQVAGTDVSCMPGAVELLDELTVPLAVASNTPEPLLSELLQRAGILGRFTVVAGPDDKHKPKPAPDVYLQACRELGVRPSATHALDDSHTGVQAALAAGMVVTQVCADIPTAGMAHRTVGSLAELSWNSLTTGEDVYG